MKIYTARQMREAEATAVAAGTSYETLMENAGTKAAEELLKRAGQPSSVLILCGKGNNGGDGLVVARLLAEAGWDVCVSFLCGEDLSPLSALNRERLPQVVTILSPACLAGEISRAAYLVDGVFGTGFHGELPAAVKEIFRRANSAAAVRVSLDLPSGMDCDTGAVSSDTFRADLTDTFGAYKPALLMESSQAYCGEVSCLEIGLLF